MDARDDSIPTPSIELIYVLNAVALALQQSIHGVEDIYAVFQEQVVALGLRGGISEVDESGQALTFKTVAYNNPLARLLKRFEKTAGTTAQGFTIPVQNVDVYGSVVREKKAVFVPDTSVISAQVVPSAIKGVVAPLLRLLGNPPGIFAPMIVDGEVRGMLNMVGADLKKEDIPTLQAFANQIAVALENAHLVEKLQAANTELETAYQSTLEGWVQAFGPEGS